MSISVSKLAKRSFIMGRRLCPPAMSRDDLPSWSNEIAWSTEVARAYLNGAGTCMMRDPLFALKTALRSIFAIQTYPTLKNFSPVSCSVDPRKHIYHRNRHRDIAAQRQARSGHRRVRRGPPTGHPHGARARAPLVDGQGASIHRYDQPDVPNPVARQCHGEKDRGW